MAVMVDFVKMHGAGNDYIYVDGDRFNIPNPAKAAIAWSNRHFGVGADGLVLISRCNTGSADFAMRIFNADGSEGMMCGNASRCVGKYLYEYGFTDKSQVRLLTRSGVKNLELTVDEHNQVKGVTVDMLAPKFSDPASFLPQGTPLPSGVFVSMGNPHYVIFVDDVSRVNVDVEGPRLENHVRFPNRCNIEFVEVCSAGLRVRVWERGSGVTMACGTGACATVAAAVVTGRASREARVIMEGGILEVEWRESDNHIYLKGPAQFVFKGKVPLIE